MTQNGRHLIVNADDFGVSTGINRAVLDCHRQGIVTSASLMVTGAAADEAARIAADNPALSVGMHWDVWGEDERAFDVADLAAVRLEFAAQLERFIELVGHPPTHVDSHKHAHRGAGVADVLRELLLPLHIPLRDDGQVRYVGAFYAQWEWLLTDLAHVSVAALERLLMEEVDDGWTELACHPGYASPDFTSVYLAEREAEVRTLLDPRIRARIDELGIRLCSYADHARWRERQR